MQSVHRSRFFFFLAEFFLLHQHFRYITLYQRYFLIHQTLGDSKALPCESQSTICSVIALKQKKQHHLDLMQYTDKKQAVTWNAIRGLKLPPVEREAILSRFRKQKEWKSSISFFFLFLRHCYTSEIGLHLKLTSAFKFKPNQVSNSTNIITCLFKNIEL